MGEADEAGSVEKVGDDFHITKADCPENIHGFIRQIGVYLHYASASWRKRFAGNKGDGSVEYLRVLHRSKNSHKRLPIKHIRSHGGFFGKHHIRRISGKKVAFLAIQYPDACLDI